MTKTIKDLYDKKVWEIDFSPEPSLAFAEGFESGANAVLEEIEHWMNTRYSFSFVEFKNFVKQLKG